MTWPMRKPAAAAAALLAAIVLAVPGTAPAAPATLQTVTPGAGTVSGNIVWEVSASGAAVSRIDFSLDGTQRWTEYQAPYRFNGDAGNLDTRTLPNGSHTLTARATSTTGETSTTTVTVTVQNDSGSSFAVQTVTPTAGATLSGAVTWEAKMTAGSASQIDFSIDGTQRWTERLAPYRFNGDTGALDTTTLSNGSHTLTVLARDAAGHTATSATSVTISNGTAPPPPPSTTANRTVYCFGAPSYGTGGWAYDGTSLGWIRQYPSGLPQRVGYDGSVSLMSGLGCNTMKAEIQANDPDPNGGTDTQRAQLYSTDSLLSKYGAQPPLGMDRGTYRWYGFAFSTNGGYKPQASASWPNFNYIFSWHNGGANASGPPNIIVEVASASQSGCGQPYAMLSQPKIAVELNGGDPAKFPYNGATCRRFFGPAFTPGARYTVQMGVKWADNGTGTFEVWVNDQQVASVSSVSTMWLNQAVYPVFENYRPGKAMIGNAITWTNTVYYGGLVTGPTRADVALPSS